MSGALQQHRRITMRTHTPRPDRAGPRPAEHSGCERAMMANRIEESSPCERGRQIASSSRRLIPSVTGDSSHACFGGTKIVPSGYWH
jgi:hypothetical protein